MKSNFPRIFFLSIFLSIVTTSIIPKAMAGQDPIKTELPEIEKSVIELIAQHPKVQQAFLQIEEARETNNQWLIEITEIAAPPFAEKARALDMAIRLKDLGMQNMTIDEAGNVYSIREGTKGDKTLAIIAHLDTVFPEETIVTVRREGDVFYAPGVGDNSRGLVAMLSLIDVLETLNLSTEDNIMFVASVGEEGLGDLRGVRHLFREGGPKIDSVIAIDGGQLHRVVTTAVGSHRYRVSFDGPGGHSYGSFGRAHPHQALAQAISLFTEYATPITQTMPKATFSVGRIGGGTSINSIPFKSWMEVDMRSANPEKLAHLDTVFQTAMQEALAVENARRRLGPEIALTVTPVGVRPAGQTDPQSSLVRNTVNALAFLGQEAELSASSTDANVAMAKGIPAVTLSRGGISKNAHSPDESWEDRDAHLAIQMLLLVTLAETNWVASD